MKNLGRPQTVVLINGTWRCCACSAPAPSLTPEQMEPAVVGGSAHVFTAISHHENCPLADKNRGELTWHYWADANATACDIYSPIGLLLTNDPSEVTCPDCKQAAAHMNGRD